MAFIWRYTDRNVHTRAYAQKSVVCGAERGLGDKAAHCRSWQWRNRITLTEVTLQSHCGMDPPPLNTSYAYACTYTYRYTYENIH